MKKAKNHRPSLHHRSAQPLQPHRSRKSPSVTRFLILEKTASDSFFEFVRNNPARKIRVVANAPHRRHLPASSSRSREGLLRPHAYDNTPFGFSPLGPESRARAHHLHPHRATFVAPTKRREGPRAQRGTPSRRFRHRPMRVAATITGALTTRPVGGSRMSREAGQRRRRLWSLPSFVECVQASP